MTGLFQAARARCAFVALRERSQEGEGVLKAQERLCMHPQNDVRASASGIADVYKKEESGSRTIHVSVRWPFFASSLPEGYPVLAVGSAGWSIAGA